MTRTTRLLLPLLLASGLGVGCSPDSGTLDGAPVAIAGTDSLSATALVAMLLQSPQLPSEDLARGAITIWVDNALAIAAAQNGPPLDDDATLERIARPDVVAGVIEAYAATRTGSVVPTEAQVDSLVRTNSVRAFRRLARTGIAPSDTTGLIAAGRQLMELRQRITTEGSTDAAIRALGASSANIEVSITPAYAHGEIPSAVAEAIWRLQPGEVSMPLAGLGGAQIFERLPAEAVREQLTAWLGPQLQREEDRRYIDSTMAARQLRIPDDAIARLRRAASEPQQLEGDAPLATWQDGELTAARANEWLATMAAPERAQLALESDSALTSVLRLMGRREILFGIATAAGIDASPIRTRLFEDYRTRIDSLLTAARAAASAEAWLGEVLGGRTRFVRFPGALPALLRQRFPVSWDPARMEVALQEAKRTWQAPTPTTP